MKTRVYRCPICGKTYASLKDMYICAQNCEAQEIKNENKVEKERAAAEQGILNKYKALQNEINDYNKKYSSNHFNIIELTMKYRDRIIRTENKDNSRTEKNETKTAFNDTTADNEYLESFLKNELGLEPNDIKKVMKEGSTKNFNDYINEWAENLINNWGF